MRYFGQASVESCQQEAIAPLISTQRDKHNLSSEERFSEPAALAEGADTLEAMKHRLEAQDD